MKFTLYWKKLGEHIHVRIFSKGAFSGKLVFNQEEWTCFSHLLQIGMINWTDLESPHVIFKGGE